jgi:type III pantothenate kinase
MLLAIDIGNTNITLGLFEEDLLKLTARLATDSRKTADEYAIDIKDVLSLHGEDVCEIEDCIISSVVPAVGSAISSAVALLCHTVPLMLGPGVKTGLNIKLTNQTQVGADIVADAVAALEKFEAPIVTIDMGTATTIGVISEGRNYEGGMLLPGVNVSLEALSHRAAQLPDISLQHPKTLIGKNTEECMRSGIVYGTAGMLDGIIDRIREQFPGKFVTVVATGGNAPVIVRYCRNQIVYDKYLLMDGLWTIYQKNK